MQLYSQMKQVKKQWLNLITSCHHHDSPKPLSDFQEQCCMGYVALNLGISPAQMGEHCITRKSHHQCYHYYNNKRGKGGYRTEDENSRCADFTSSYTGRSIFRICFCQLADEETNTFYNIYHAFTLEIANI